MCPQDEYYLTLNISFGSGTRAGTPEGDEDGDGRENGRFHENDIDNICFFIYNDGGKMFNAANGATTFKFKGYVDALAFSGATSYTTLPMPINGYRPETGDRIVVVANLGDIRGSNNTIADLRNAQVTKAQSWTASTDIADYDDFAMTSATEDATNGTVSVTHVGDYADPFMATVEVERIAARVDWILPLDGGGNPDVSTNGAKYDVPELGTEGTLYVKNIRMVNESQMNTYLIRRTSPTVDGAVTYMGKVELDANNFPDRYVIEPLTSTKKGSTPISSGTLNTWFNATSFANSKLSGFFPAGTTYDVNTNAAVGKRFTVDGNTCYTLGYVMENTMDISQQNNDIRTGVELKCVFVPQKIYTYSGALNLVAGPYTYGRDFYYLQNLDDRTQSMFFASAADRAAYVAANPAVRHRDIDYIGGVCYYYIWLKHADSGKISDEGTYPMEYAVVRNNIYRIKIEQVLSIGTATPETTPRELIKVRQWNKRVQPVIRL